MIHLGDCLEVMKTMEAWSVDTIITDPPYGLSFMGKEWDYDIPSVEIWKECLRVLRPGGTALIFAGNRTYHRMACNVEDAGFIIKDCIMWLYGSGFPKAADISKQLDKRKGKQRNIGVKVRKDTTGYRMQPVSTESLEPITAEAIQWNGWKSHGLKPAYEPIIVAMKPNDGSYANNALKHGVSGLNIDGGRIGTEKIVSNGDVYRTGQFNIQDTDKKYVYIVNKTTHRGRFPANIILDKEAAAMLGEPSRFFYCAKASSKERNAGCEGLEEKEAKRTMSGGEDTRGRPIPINKNHHPTVKPLKLMEYLCTLTKTPTGGVVLDPFAGSGTTGLACQNTGREYILIEKNPEYFNIMECRLKKAL